MEQEMATHSSILPWKNPRTEESGGLKSMGLHDWACVHEGGGRWAGSNKLAELKKKKSCKEKVKANAFQILFSHLKKEAGKLTPLLSKIMKQLTIHKKFSG